MATWRMSHPNNKLPVDAYDKVVILNLTSDVIFQDAFGREEPEMEGDIILKPRQGTSRFKFTAKHWFGDWDKEGSDWVAEVERLKSRYGPMRPVEPPQYGPDGRLLQKENPVWTAIKDHKLVVKGCTENKNYLGSVTRQFTDLKPTFNIDETPDDKLVESILGDRGKRGDVFEIDETVKAEIRQEVLKANPEHDNSTTVTKLKGK